MPKFAANLSLMFNEHDFLDRFEAAAKAGFTAVEFLFPYAFPANEIAARLKGNGLTQALFNAPPGDWDGGERGVSALPGREQEFRESISTALRYATTLECKTLHVMAGIPHESIIGNARSTYVRNLVYASRAAAKEGVTVVIEPLNTRDNPGYLITHQGDGVGVIKDVDEKNIGLQFDFYHCQIMQGDLARNLEKYMKWIKHIQIAGVPERHEPDVGEINFPYLFDRIDSLGYSGWVGCEYRPLGDTVAGLGWMKTR